MHDWTDREGWEGLHIYWLTEIARDLWRHPPAGYRGIIGSSPLDMQETDISVSVEWNGRLFATAELISLRNKDRPMAREQYAARYMNSLCGGTHLLLVDVHRRPLGFGFPQMIATGFGELLPSSPAPVAASYRVGASTGGKMLAIVQKTLTIGEPIPAMPMPFDLDQSVMIDLDGTYAKAAADC